MTQHDHLLRLRKPTYLTVALRFVLMHALLVDYSPSGAQTGIAMPFYPDAVAPGRVDQSYYSITAAFNTDNQVDQSMNNDIIGVLQTFYRDFDGDGFGDPAKYQLAALQPAGYVTNNLDCNDFRTFYQDNDNDGWGNSTKIPCGIITRTGDCDDNNHRVHSLQTFYRDADGDSWGNAAVTTVVCSSIPPEGYVANRMDCNDNNKAIRWCPPPTVCEVSPGQVTGAQTICRGGNPAVLGSTTAATGNGVITYQWQSNTTGCNGNFSNIPGATTPTYAPPPLNTTTFYRRVATNTLNGVPCTAISNCVEIIINSITSGTIGNAQTICSGGDPSILTGLTPLFVSNASFEVNNWNTGSGPSLNLDATGIAGWITTDGAPASSFFLEGWANGNGAGPTPFGNQWIALGDEGLGGNSVAQTIAGFMPGESYAVTFSISSETSLAGARLRIAFPSGSPTPSAEFTAPLAAIHSWDTWQTFTYNFVANATEVTIRFLDISSAGNTALGLDNISVARLSGTATGNGVITYQWQSNTTGCNGSFTNIPGATDPAYDPPPQNVTTFYRRVATSTLNGVACSAISNCVEITVKSTGTAVVAASVTSGMLQFSGGGKNFFNSLNSFVPGGDSNFAARSTASTKTHPSTEYSFADGANNDVARFSDNTLTITDISKAGAAPFKMTFQLTPGAASSVSKLSDNFPNGGQRFSLVNDLLTISMPGINGSGNFSAIYAVVPSCSLNAFTIPTVKLGTTATNNVEDERSALPRIQTQAFRDHPSLAKESSLARGILASVYPNPYTGRVRFVLQSPISGEGKLDLYNLAGQKVQTVFLGLVTAGHQQTIDYVVPPAQKTDLLYQFQLNGEQTAGILLYKR